MLNGDVRYMMCNCALMVSVLLDCIVIHNLHSGYEACLTIRISYTTQATPIPSLLISHASINLRGPIPEGDSTVDDRI